MNKIIFSIIILLLLPSCKSKVENILINGDWSIDSFYLNCKTNNNLLYGFMFLFNEDFKCQLPQSKFDVDIYSNKKKIGKWEIEELNPKEYKLNIYTENKIINGKFSLKFWYYKEASVLLMTLEKDSLIFINYDHWNSYNPNEKFIINNTYDYEEMEKYLKSRCNKMKLNTK